MFGNHSIPKFIAQKEENPLKKIETDYLIIGSGLAGLYSAFYASNFGTVALITKTTLEVSASFWAQGGIAAAMGAEDSIINHFDDTIESGKGLCDEEAVKILVEEGKDRIEELIKLGVPFDLEAGKIALGLEGGHSHRRVLRAGGDSTGKEIVNFLIWEVRDKENITVNENTIVYRLLEENGECFGALAYDYANNEQIIYYANAVIIAAGGASGIYKRTTNPHTSTGDGIALSYFIGAEVSDIEFIQFHPTALFTETGETFLISEAVRGEGAFLLNENRKRFMPEYHKSAELASRDIVSKAIFDQIQYSTSEFVYLDLTHLDSEKLKNRFSTIYAKSLQLGFDFTKELLPVAPAAHYTIGGIKAGLNSETNIKRLFVCGEAASTGVHGANRLASNSLLECLVFGKRAVDSAKNLNKYKFDYSDFKDFNYHYNNQKIFTEAKNEIAVLLNVNAGIVRDEKNLKKVLESIKKVKEKLEFDENEYFALRLKELTSVAELIIRFALKRKESRGGHIRLDYPEKNSDFLGHFSIKKNEDFTFEKKLNR